MKTAQFIESVTNEDNVLVYAFVPGASKEDVEVTVKDVTNSSATIKIVANVSSVSSEQLEKTSLPGKYEYYVGLYRKTLDKEIDLDSASVKVENGLLTLTVPRKEISVRKIQVQ